MMASMVAAAEELPRLRGMLVMRDGQTLAEHRFNGGAIALGHPYGMSGIRYLGSTLMELARRGKSRAVVGVCTAGGMATAAYLERV